MFGTQEEANLLMKSYCGTPGYMAPEVVIAGDVPFFSQEDRRRLRLQG